MKNDSSTSPRAFNRRAILGLLIAAPLSSAAAADHPSMAFMRQFAKDMLNANRQGTVASFKAAIQRHADVAQIAEYSLGQYKGKLTPAQRQRYYNGVATFMARYFADQSREYRVAKYELGDAAAEGQDVVIDSKVYLVSGKSYTVVWRLARNHGAYKMVDTKVLGFSLAYMQRGLFTSYISKRNGDVNQLIAVLNR
ncbi:MAG TPA: ABC transporter substrate-binding protein [Aestuariivirga sp.]|nr:ABC transporter substrate-binding protein [Aestuariivirga sp.]